MTEAEQVRYAKEVAEKARKFYLDASKDRQLQNRFHTDPVGAFADYGIGVPEEYHEAFLATHKTLMAANEGFLCKLCKSSLYVALLACGVTVLAVVASAIAVFFGVALAVAEAVIAAAVAANMKAFEMAGVACASAKMSGPCAL